MSRSSILHALLTAAIALASHADARAQACTFVAGPDIVVADLVGPANYSAASGLEALALGHVACNLGDDGVDWLASTNRHPVFGGSLYRYKDMGGWSAFEQVGQGWLLHGFFALSSSFCCSNCVATDGTQLGVGCADTSTANRAGSQHGLGPKWQVNAASGAFAYPPANPSWSGSTARRVQVAIADLEPTASSTTQYYAEVATVAPDDAEAGNGDNNASHRRVVVSGSDESWTFAFGGSTQRERPAIRAWRDIDPAVEELDITVPPEGSRLILAQRVTDLGGGTWHYEYALHNLNSHESIRSFSVPLPTGATVTGIGFHDVAYRNGDGEGNVDRDGTDWPGVVTGSAITFETAAFATDPNANALRWGTTYNFRFDADAPPTHGVLRLGRFRTPGDFAVPGALVPAGAATFCDGSDASLASCPCANAGDPDSGCDNAQATGGVRIELLAQTTAPNGATLLGSGFPSTSTPTALVIRSAVAEPAAPFGDGVECLAFGSLVRLAATTASGGTSTHVVPHGAPAGSGAFAYQIWYRNTPSTYCDAFAAFNLSNAVSLEWGGP